MKILFLDLETTYKLVNDRKNPSPYYPGNRIVSAGVQGYDGNRCVFNDYHFYFHSGYPNYNCDPCVRSEDALQLYLDWADLLVCHNVKFDLSWIKESGYTYEGPTYDTMLCEYLFARGEKLGLGLEDSCIRRKVAAKKSDLIQKYMDDNVSFEDIPWRIVEEYGKADVQSLVELYFAQQALLADDFRHMLRHLDMCNQFVHVLIELERNGIAIDQVELNRLEKEYKEEQQHNQTRLQELIHKFVGDTPININSPEQLSAFIYSRAIIDKHKWKEIFNIGSEQRGHVKKPKRRTWMSNKEFVEYVRKYTRVIKRTRAEACKACEGKGYYHKITRSGAQFRRSTSCRSCGGAGFVCTDEAKIGGLKCIPTGPQDAAVGGFSTDKDTLVKLAKLATGEAQEFLKLMVRQNAIETYLSTFIEGIRKGIVGQLLRTEFMQFVTATGRLSSRNPNFQNQPRGATFPVRRVVVSRFPGGKIIEADFKTLEFTTAGGLARCKVAKNDILNKVDVHTNTSKTLTDAGQPTNRQDAKPHTFKPLYGGSSGTEAEQTYYQSFLRKYTGIARWHTELQAEAIRHKRIRMPTGKEFAFPMARRLRNGESSYATQIKNYPVQYLATGEIVPIALINALTLFNNWRIWNLRSVLILTVHDCAVVDCFPGEEDIVEDILHDAMTTVNQDLIERYGYDLEMPLDIEIKSGANWLDLKEIKHVS